MQEETLPKWAKPKRAASAKDAPLVIRIQDSADSLPEESDTVEPIDSPTLPAVPQIVTAIGIRPCMNARWIIADLAGQKIKVRILKSRKSPRNQSIKCRHIEGDHYEEIR